MSKMFAEIRRIVDEDISNRITQLDVIFEGITNSIHANSTQIVCEFDSSDNPLDTAEGKIVEKKVDSIVIRDNGEGLTNDNYRSFCNYRSDFKKKLGCKGVGRFVFLKVYRNAIYESALKIEAEKRDFIFDIDFDTENLNVNPATGINENETVVKLLTLVPAYHNSSKHIDRRIELNLASIREKALLNLLPTLFFYKKKGVEITIKFVDITTGTSINIEPGDIPDFKQKLFTIENRKGEKFEFILNHTIEDKIGQFRAFHCANNRTVCEFADKDFKLSLPYGYSGYVLLESEYFDERVNNERNDFNIFPVRTDLYSSLSWEMINDEMKKSVTELVKEGIPDTERINTEKITEIYNDRPYLVNYIEESDIDIAGFLDKRQLIDKAKKRFDVAKEKVLSSTGKDEYSDRELQEAIELAQNELVSYINDRVLVIERLRTMVDSKERVEAVIHNLFMEQQTDDDYFTIGKNNLWLLDDRYTTYSYAASDKRINEVLKTIGEEREDTIGADRPDLSLFFSHNPNTPQRLKSVLVEIKPFDYPSKPDRKKFAGIQQLLDYVEAFKKKENIEEVYAYLITDIDDDLAQRLKNDDYKPLFSLEYPIYFRYYQATGISIFVISATTLIKDAEARNKIFLDIIKKQSRINNYINTGLAAELEHANEAV